MVDAIDQEIQAIRTLLQVLEPLSARARRSALEYVLRRLEIELPGDEADGAAPAGSDATGQSTGGKVLSQGEVKEVHLKVFKEQKKPKSDNEMAAIVAYYLAKVAPADARKQSISTEDIETYFNIGEYPLPKEPRQTLQNAKRAGYFKQVGTGQYALNPVGLNLVAYSLPRAGAETPQTKRLSRKMKKLKKATAR